MPNTSSTSTSQNHRRQRAAERTNIALLRYVLDHPNATCKDAASDLEMSFPNVCRLVAMFKGSNLIVPGEQVQTGKRGPWSQVLALRADISCVIGIDLEATHVRGVVMDFANNVTGTLRQPIPPTASPSDIVSTVADMGKALVKNANARRQPIGGLGLALPGPMLDRKLGSIRTDLQFGEATVEFVPAVHKACGIPVTATANSYCFAAGHHRMHNPRGTGVEMVVLNRFGLSATIVWNGQVYTGASHYAGDLGLLPCCTVSPTRRYQDVCTGNALISLARSRGDRRTFEELLDSPDDALVREWLDGAVPAFAQAIYAAVITYNPDRVLIEGIFSRLPVQIREQIVTAVTDELEHNANMLPEIRFFEGDDLMGARGAALLARDAVADHVLVKLLRSSGSTS